MSYVAIGSVVFVVACSSQPVCPTIVPIVPHAAISILTYHHDLVIEPARMKVIRQQRDRDDVALMTACKSGNDRACTSLARGMMVFVPEVAASVRRACTNGDARACRLLPPDDRPGYDKPCTDSPKTCSLRLEADCQRGIPQACRDLGRRVHDPALVRRASQLAQAGCAAGIDHECALLESTNTSVRDQVLAWSRNCEETGTACPPAASALRVAGDVVGARYLLEVRCQLIFFCFELQSLYRTRSAPELYPGRLAELEALLGSHTSPIPTGAAP